MHRHFFSRYPALMTREKLQDTSDLKSDRRCALYYGHILRKLWQVETVFAFFSPLACVVNAQVLAV